MFYGLLIVMWETRMNLTNKLKENEGSCFTTTQNETTTTKRNKELTWWELILTTQRFDNLKLFTRKNKLSNSRCVISTKHYKKSEKC